MRALMSSFRRSAVPAVTAQKEQGQIALEEPVMASSAAQNDLVDLVEDDLRRTRRQITAASQSMATRIVAGAELATRIVSDAEALANTIDAAVADVDALTEAFNDIAHAGEDITTEINAATQLADKARSGAERAGEGVLELRAAIRRIESVVGLISKVAKQTNLLALNATIEAERAGVLGRGFAVVASEVKSLSTETQRATDEITRTLGALQHAAETSSQTVGEVADLIEEISPSFLTVSAAVGNQSRFIHLAAGRADHMRGFVKGVSERAAHMKSTSIDVAGGVNGVRDAAASLADLNDRASTRLMTVLRQTPAADRRKHDRFPATTAVTLRAGSTSAPTETVDVSLGGFLAKPCRDLDLQVGQSVEADLPGIGAVSARIAAVSGQGVHLAFVNPPAAVQTAITRYVEGLQADYQRLIDRSQQTSRQISAALENAISRGEISLEALFDTDYQPINGTDPQQFEVKALTVLEGILSPIQEALLASDARMVFCAAVDRNGYLPVHNLVFSKPQRPGEPAWNAANSRNKRIFDDRTGLLAGRNTRPFLIQAYQRDMGNGVSVLMKELDTPIMVSGRHWGGFRMAYKL
jgi:methyl-accepting chemotaxis protein